MIQGQLNNTTVSAGLVLSPCVQVVGHAWLHLPASVARLRVPEAASVVSNWSERSAGNVSWPAHVVAA